MTHRRPLAALALLLFAASAAGGCSSTKSGGKGRCTPGESRACTGPGGCLGGQVCEEGIGFGECVCEGAGGAGGAGTMLPPRGLTCDYYCAVIADNCTNEDQQYTTKNMCAGVCGTLPAGSLADDGGNTLGCRINAAEAAKGSPRTNCPIAGPSGAGSCGTNCEGYCSIFQAVCGEFASDEECLATCAGYAEVDDPGYNTTIRAGDTMLCRVYHVSAAAEAPPASANTHCPHSRAVPEALCLD